MTLDPVGVKTPFRYYLHFFPKKETEIKYEFKKTIVNLYQSGKTYSQIHEEYGISHSALSNWVKKYGQVQIDDGTILNAQQVIALQKRNADLEEENLILKKAHNFCFAKTTSPPISFGF